RGVASRVPCLVSRDCSGRHLDRRTHRLPFGSRHRARRDAAGGDARGPVGQAVPDVRRVRHSLTYDPRSKRTTCGRGSTLPAVSSAWADRVAGVPSSITSHSAKFVRSVFAWRPFTMTRRTSPLSAVVPRTTVFPSRRDTFVMTVVGGKSSVGSSGLG